MNIGSTRLPNTSLLRTTASLLPPTHTIINAGQESLRLFASRLALGQLRRLREGLYAYCPPDSDSPKTASSANGSAEVCLHPSGAFYPPSVADFLSVCPVFFVADRGGSLVAASYPATDTALLAEAPKAQNTHQFQTGAAAASSPAHALFSLGIFFMSAKDAKAYLHHVSKDSSSHFHVRSTTLRKAYGCLRYVDSNGRRAAGEETDGRILSLFRRTRRFFSGSQGKSMRCILVPNTQTLCNELSKSGKFEGIPVYTLPAIDTRGDIAKSRVLRQLRAKLEQKLRRNKSTSRPLCYPLLPIETSPGRWILALAFNGSLRQPFFCSDRDAIAAYRALTATLPPGFAEPSPKLTVYSLEKVLNNPHSLPTNDSSSLQGGQERLPTLLLPDTEEIAPDELSFKSI
ncbi:hypothetical protein cyc_00517 [Cyclospora cayetanensis]|uniref:Uncharacterized protein n=1 Tax=Cyclospora cayetanensis TaxID=88456 RepID=A0A1D3D8J3_9EIME|nr:hypothetical protein cyc_00517 [Cyclospora cayetanensis]